MLWKYYCCIFNWLLFKFSSTSCPVSWEFWIKYFSVNNFYSAPSIAFFRQLWVTRWSINYKLLNTRISIGQVASCYLEDFLSATQTFGVPPMLELLDPPSRICSRLLAFFILSKPMSRLTLNSRILCRRLFEGLGKLWTRRLRLQACLA